MNMWFSCDRHPIPLLLTRAPTVLWRSMQVPMMLVGVVVSIRNVPHRLIFERMVPSCGSVVLSAFLMLRPFHTVPHDVVVMPTITSFSLLL